MPLPEFVVDLGDGSYTFPDQPGHNDGGMWTVRDTGEGWEVGHSIYSRPRAARFATADDAVAAVCVDAAPALLWNGSTFGDVYGPDINCC